MTTPRRTVVINGIRVTDPRHTRAWRVLRDQVVREEPLCRLKLRGCTIRSTTGDHIITVEEAPELALVRSNVQGACRSCNYRRGNLSLDELRRDPEAAANDPATRPDALSIFD